MHDEDGSSKLNELVKQQDASCGEVDWETLLTIGCGENRQEMLPQHGSQNETLRSMWKNQKGRIAEFSSLNTPQNMAIGAEVHDTTGRSAKDHSEYIETSERQPAQATEATLSSSQATEDSHASVTWQATEEVGASLPFNSMLQLLSDIDGKQYAFDQHANQFVCTQEAVCTQQAGAIEPGATQSADSPASFPQTQEV